jgi:hypothetical protein
MAFKPRCTYWNKGMIQTADPGEWRALAFLLLLMESNSFQITE